MHDRGLLLSGQAIRRQLAAMPHELYLVRLIHHPTRTAFPGERLWTATQLEREATIRFLRLRNREGCDIYIQPYAEDDNAGYILLDLDHAPPAAVERMQRQGHEPCVVLQTSPGHLQAWIHVSLRPLPLSLATRIARHLASTYGGDLASAEGRHLGRLAGFTNQKPQRRQSHGDAPWVRLLYARRGLATKGPSLVHTAKRQAVSVPDRAGAAPAVPPVTAPADLPASDGQAAAIYQTWLHRLRIPQRFPHTDWSIADAWIAQQLLLQGTPAVAVQTLLRQGSPGFPRRHGDPQDYLRRTLAHALRRIAADSFPARARGAACVRAPPSSAHGCLPGSGDRGGTS